MPPIDRPERVAQGHVVLSELVGELAMVKFMVEAFNVEAEKHTGRPSRLYASGGLERSKHYPGLVKAARALLEHEIAPQAWVAWRLDYAKHSGWAMGLSQVYSAKTIQKLRGFFRASHPAGVSLKVERVHHEQVYRAREAWMRWEDGRVRWVLFPAWYSALRRQEMDEGDYDPLTWWPKAPAPAKVRRL